MAIAHKNRASKQRYISTNQLKLEGYSTPFDQHLDPNNRWVILASKLPWDELVETYNLTMRNRQTGAEGINGRVIIGSIIIKHICDLSDRDTIQLIQENVYMQYFIGYSSFSREAPFDASLMVEARKRLTGKVVNKINERIILWKKEFYPQDTNQPKQREESTGAESKSQGDKRDDPPLEGQLIMDATACPQDIAYPTDLNVLNDAREKSEEIIDYLHGQVPKKTKPRTYRKNARKVYLKTAQKRSKSRKEIRKAIKQQLNYVRRNISTINQLLDQFDRIPMNEKQLKYFYVIQTVYTQQKEMYDAKKHSVDHRIVSIHQPHVRPIVRGKVTAPVEFGAKIQVSLMNGFAFTDEVSWDAFNEGTRLIDSVEKYKQRLGYYPAEVLADKIYCNRDNRSYLKGKGIHLKAKPLGRPPAVPIHLSPGERNPIEGKFGQAKNSYGLNRIKARLKETSESWIASIFLVLNLVKLAGQVPYFLFYTVLDLIDTCLICIQVQKAQKFNCKYFA